MLVWSLETRQFVNINLHTWHSSLFRQSWAANGRTGLPSGLGRWFVVMVRLVAGTRAAGGIPRTSPLNRARSENGPR